MIEDGSVLDDITVLECGGGIAVAYCGKLLAGLGARVIKLEPPGGDGLRRLGPFAADDPHPEKSGLFLYLNTGKQSVLLDQVRRLDGAIETLLRDADVVIDDSLPGQAAGLATARTCRRTPFGTSSSPRLRRSGRTVHTATTLRPKSWLKRWVV